MNDVGANDLDTILARIRAQANAENIRITQHAQQEMVEENVTLNDVLETITTGQILEKLPRASERFLLFNQWFYKEWAPTPRCVHDNATGIDHYYGV